MANLVFDFLHHYVTGERRASDPADAYQYDEGHVMEAVVPVAVTSCEIHYWVRGQEEAEAYVPESITQNDDGSYSIIGHIPNTYFETYGELRVYIVVTDGTASITTYEGRIHICERSKPDDYVDDDPDNEAVQIIAAARGYAETSEAWAVGQINGEDVPSTADQYQNNASYYADQAASAASSAAAQASLAPAYDNTATYEVGDYCLYSGQLYECTTAITTAEAWDSTHWTAVTVGGELSTVKEDSDDLKSALDSIDLYVYSEHAGFLTANGTYSNPSINYHSLTSEKISCAAGDKFIYSGYGNGNAISALFYNSSDTIIDTAKVDGSVNPQTITIPSNCISVVFSSYAVKTSPVKLNVVKQGSIFDRLDKTEAKANQNESDIDDIQETLQQMMDTGATLTLGTFINSSGNVSSAPYFAKTGDIKLAKGNTIRAYVKGYNTALCIVAVKNTNGTYTAKVLSEANQNWKEYTYTATEDCIVVISSYSDAGTLTSATITIVINGETLQGNLIDLKNGIDAVDAKTAELDKTSLTLEFIDGEYINYLGNPASNSDFMHSKDIHLAKDQTIVFTAKGAGTAVALLAMHNVDSATYTPLIISENATPVTKTYKATAPCEVTISSDDSYTVTASVYITQDRITYDANAIDTLETETVSAIQKNLKKLNADKYNSGNFDSEINMFIAYGQSWSVGYGAHAITLTPKYDNIMLNIGIKNNPLADTSLVATSFSPMVEADGVGETTDLVGETVVTSQSCMVKQLIEEENGYVYTDFPYQILGIAPGYGSQSLAQLSKGTDWYNRLIAQVQQAKGIADNLGKKLVVQAFSWLQNALGGGLTGTYAENLEQLRSDIDEDVKAITGQTQDVKCITWQTFSYENNGAKNCYDKYVGASETYPNIICSGASYQFTHITENNLHLDSVSQDYAGALLGVAYKRTIVDGEKFIPLKPISATVSGKIAYLKFNVPQKPLCFDTTVVTSASNYGFEIQDSSKNSKTITNVSIVSPDTVKIVCASNIESTDHIIYGQNGGTNFGPTNGNRGNLRDSNGEFMTYTAGNGVVIKLHNWCVIFDKVISELTGI